jgi:ABC-type phosphate transport system substrate-binding protein
MSGHNTEPGPQPHHARHPAIRAAAAALILLALGACSRTTTTPATSAAASAEPGTLTGAGSTYVAPFFTLAFTRYHQQHPAVTVTYSPVGSSAGIAAISARRLHLTGPVLAAIYLGQITRWNDPAITALNPGITFPPAPRGYRFMGMSP